MVRRYPLALGKWLRRPRTLKVVAAVALLGLLLSGYWRVTSYLDWKRDLRLGGFVSELEVPGEGQRVLVVAPHPDDETLGCGGLIHEAVTGGAEVFVVVMTNGDASQWSVLLGDRQLPRGARNFIRLGNVRQKETLAAVAKLGVPPDHVTFLSYPNDGLVELWRPEHWTQDHLYTSPDTKADHSPYKISFTPNAPYCGEQVLTDLMALLRQIKPTQVFVTHPLDNHSDHWTTAAFVRFALRTLEAKGERGPDETRVYGYMIHWPGWPIPRSYVPRLALLPPVGLPARMDDAWLRLPLSPNDLQLKTAAIRTYRTQMPRHDRLLLAFSRPNELFAELVAPQLYPDATLHWWGTSELGGKPAQPRHNLGGAQIHAVSLALNASHTISGVLHTAARRLPPKAYLCLDLRTWDVSGEPLITNLTIAASGQAHSVQVTPRGMQELTAKVEHPQAGVWSISELPLPPEESRRQPPFVTCWGSAGDRFSSPVPPG